MSQEHIITREDITNLLASGAFLRDGDRVHVLQGPFTPIDDDKRREISVSCPAFYQTERIVPLQPRSVAVVGLSDFVRALLRWVEEVAEPAAVLKWEEPSRDDFERAFARVQNLISEGQIDKAVPVVFARASAKVTASQRARWMLALLTAPASLNVHGWWDGEEGLIGATPEVLFDLEGRHLRTMALAGTLAKTDGSANDLVRSTKDQHEHRIVVDDISRELKSFGRVRVGETHVAELPTLWHLRTNLDVDLESDPSIEELIKRLHPTAALGVFPRQFGWRWMNELPGQSDRARFGAPFTMRLSTERVVSLVAIRNLQWSGERVLLGSGCGVVKGSELEAEWTELIRKRQSVLKLLEMMP